MIIYDVRSMMFTFYHQTKISIDFLCKQGSNFKSLIQRQISDLKVRHFTN